MSGDIGPGDLVVCVDADIHPEWGSLRPAELRALRLLRRGRHYRVAALDYDIDGAGLFLMELPTDRGFDPRRFRKLNDEPDDIALVEQIKACRPVSPKLEPVA